MRAAIDAAIGPGALASLRDAPAGVVHAVREAVGAVRREDAEGRRVVERFADVLFDELADAPGELATRMRVAFDDALRTNDMAEQLPR